MDPLIERGGSYTANLVMDCSSAVSSAIKPPELWPNTYGALVLFRRVFKSSHSTLIL